ncbi:dihydrofolate reductase family protein [Dinghuibacter silviterrae]|uniref:Dihydrofolate reductase n=1 Tax=Dinghuibacter silviterrae TaxID=1539049 RepID=A0A4R8DII2_9BACT|nr:dihydrofolate reductase family protein [Dinghuibacter silviterrae]TDW97385.1 dihydrofolate reductase [Dinghuibacter silviterrae]
MRKLRYAINLSIDGCFGLSDLVPPGDEVGTYFMRLLRDVDLLIYGRKTYQIMVPYWPDIAKNPSGETAQDVEFAQAFDSCNKIVFSRTLDKAEGSNTRIVRTDLQEEILKLKQEQGKDMLVGGVALPAQLIALGLVDEFIFVVQPILSGGGRRLFEDLGLQEKVTLKLIGSTTFTSGHIALHYVKMPSQ